MVQLDITIGSLHLLDAFEWDVSGSDSLIEQFAEVHASDLGLTGEFKWVFFSTSPPPFIDALISMAHLC